MKEQEVEVKLNWEDLRRHVRGPSASSLLVLAWLTLCTCAMSLPGGQAARLRAAWRMANTDPWSTIVVPAGYQAVEEAMQRSLEQSIMASQRSTTTSARRLSIDLLTPGLNPKLEQKAILMEDFLFDSVLATLPILRQCFATQPVACAFASTGNAAGFQAHCARRGAEIPGCCVITDAAAVTTMRMSDDIKCVLFIAVKNNVGDPVLRDIMRVCDEKRDVLYLFLNCDLTDKVTTGIQSRTTRDAFRSSFLPAFYFRNLVEINRPSLIPTETGALMYTYSRGWEVFVVNSEDISGPGSLNRYMRLPMYARKPTDPSATSPPRFLRAASFARQPGREDISEVMGRAEVINEKFRVASERKRAASFRPLSYSDHLSWEASVGVVEEAANAAGRGTDALKLFQALAKIESAATDGQTILQESDEQGTKAIESMREMLLKKLSDTENALRLQLRCELVIGDGRVVGPDLLSEMNLRLESAAGDEFLIIVKGSQVVERERKWLAWTASRSTTAMADFLQQNQVVLASDKLMVVKSFRDPYSYSYEVWKLV